jgi:hypothetical protein
MERTVSGFQPGVTTRDQVHAILGEPLYTSAQWGVEVYEGSETAREWLYASLLVIPLGRHAKPTALFLVYSPDGVLQGARDLQGTSIQLGDLQGMSGSRGVVLAAPWAVAHAPDMAGAPDACTVRAVVVSKQVYTEVTALYVDGWFLQHAPFRALFSVVVQPGTHQLACTTYSARGKWSIHEPEGATLPVPRPVQRLEDSSADQSDTEGFDCKAGEVRYFAIDHKRTHCAVEELPAVEAEPLFAGAWRVVVPDQVLEKLQPGGASP